MINVEMAGMVVRDGSCFGNKDGFWLTPSAMKPINLPCVPCATGVLPQQNNEHGDRDSDGDGDGDDWDCFVAHVDEWGKNAEIETLVGKLFRV